MSKGRLLFLALLWAGSFPAALPSVRAQTTASLTTLYSFSGGGGSDGANPNALVQGPDGNFYGTAMDGGIGEYGTVFKITPAGVLTTLYSFRGGTDGGNPASGLVLGSDGNFYGTTTVPVMAVAANPVASEYPQYDTVFMVTPAGVLRTLHTFTDSGEGDNPTSLIQGSDGNFYGTISGVASGPGTVYQITPAGVFTTVYSFTGGSDGSSPNGLVQGSDGNFYGTTAGGGANNGDGTVFELTPAGVLTTLHTFTGSDGGSPEAALVEGPDGNFYGTTAGDGTQGTVFQITPAGVLTNLHTFNGSDGSYPEAPLVPGSDGNFYGTTAFGGSGYRAGLSGGGGGTIFQITPAGVLTTLYEFGDSDLSIPAAGLLPGSDGSFYGTTTYGGPSYSGTIFKLTVTTQPAFFAGEEAVGDGAYFLAFPGENYFGFYSFLDTPGYLYHFDLGYEYVFDAHDGQSGVYLYDFASGTFFYTSPSFPFPYLYDFSLNATLYYYPDPDNAGHYTTNPRYFYDFATFPGKIISK